MRFRTLFLLCISFVGAIIIVLSVTSDNSKTLRANIIASVSTTSMLPRVKDRVTITNPYSIKPNTTSSTPTTPLQENYNLKRNFCSMKFKNGDMCPPLYTDLGGKCVRNETDYLDCTDVRRLGSHSLRQAQLAITRMLGLFDNIARKYDIKYWITSATLLGAARHKGFIPWDSDADIEITLDNYERFFREASAELPEDVFFQNTESDHYLKPDTKTYETHKYKDIGMYIRTWNPRLRDRKSCYKYCMAMACKWHDGLMIDMYVVEESESAGAYPLKELLFEGLSLPVQNNWKDVLKSKYGDDYMVVPDEGSKNRQQWDWPDPDHSCEELASQKQ